MVLGPLGYFDPAFDISDRLWGGLLAHFAGCFWLVVYVRHVQHAAVAGTVASWYASTQPASSPPCRG